MKFCSNCGQRLGESCTVCPACAHPADDAVSVMKNPYDADKYRKNYSVRYVSKRPKTTIVLITINIIVWAIINLFSTSGKNIAPLLYMHGGAVCAGEIYRLFSAMFSHESLFHLLSNCYALYIYGSITESILGKKKFLFVYLASGLIGNILSFAFVSGASLGASGAVFGLLGAIIALYFISPVSIDRGMLSNVILCTVLTTVYSLRGGINNVAHFGGMAGGYLLVCLTKTKSYKKRLYTNRVLAGILVIAIFFGGLFIGFTKKANTQSKDDAIYYRLLSSYDFGLKSICLSCADKLSDSEDFSPDAYAVKAIYAYKSGNINDGTDALFTLIEKNTRGMQITLMPENIDIYKDLLKYAKASGEKNNWLDSLASALNS